jgi:hypothetical protein
MKTITPTNNSSITKIDKFESFFIELKRLINDTILHFLNNNQSILNIIEINKYLKEISVYDYKYILNILEEIKNVKENRKDFELKYISKYLILWKEINKMYSLNSRRKNAVQTLYNTYKKEKVFD